VSCAEDFNTRRASNSTQCISYVSGVSKRPPGRFESNVFATLPDTGHVHPASPVRKRTPRHDANGLGFLHSISICRCPGTFRSVIAERKTKQKDVQGFDVSIVAREARSCSHSTVQWGFSLCEDGLADVERGTKEDGRTLYSRGSSRYPDLIIQFDSGCSCCTEAEEKH
jgi:hypothetical protein